MSLKFKVNDWYDIHNGFMISINEGITSLVGRNGSGKTTLLHQIKEHYKDNNDYQILEYSNLTDGGHNALGRYLNVSNDMESLACAAMSSEGQAMMYNFGDFCSKIGSSIRTSNGKKMIILIDAMDSGTSINNIRELNDLFNLVVDDAKVKNVTVYLIIACNSYESVKNHDCIYVRSGKHYKFNSYEEYSDFICDNE